LKLVYPPVDHRTTSDRIFLIGTSQPDQPLTINGQSVHRSPAGHFAPSFPLRLGANAFQLRQGDRQLTRTVVREALNPPAITGFGFAPSSLKPAKDIARQMGESVCFEAIAPAGSQVRVQLGSRQLTLTPTSRIELPANSAVLVSPAAALQQQAIQTVQGCTTLTEVGQWQPQFRLSQGVRSLEQSGPGRVESLDPLPYRVATVTVPEAVIRSGPSGDFSRLTPLPQGTEARITGWDGDWLRLDFGGWVKASEVQQSRRPTPPSSLIRGVTSRLTPDWLEILFPLQQPVPFQISEGDRQLTLTLYNTTAQTDTIALRDTPLLEQLDWQQVRPGEVAYHLNFKGPQNWGYRLRYEGNTLVLSLRLPPRLQPTRQQPLQGLTVFLDPGHGSANDLGAVGPDGTPEKDLTLTVTRLLERNLEALGARVLMSRQGDEDLWPQDRAAQISRLQPNLALSLHYNALPDNGDAEATQGVAAFWYNRNAYSLARSLHNTLVQDLKRPSYGVFWNNLSLARPTEAPSVLLELGFLINPEEAEWITNPQAQQQLAATLAQGIKRWVTAQVPNRLHEQR
jgi:N-acetylmuramoyl-L-alanine amidase